MDDFQEPDFAEEKTSSAQQTLGAGKFKPSRDQIQIWLQQDCEMDVEQKISIKMLFVDEAVGWIIGKNGKNQKMWKDKYEISLDATDQNQFYLGTDERVLSLSGKALEVFQTFAEVVQLLDDKNKQREAEVQKDKLRTRLEPSKDQNEALHLQIILLRKSLQDVENRLDKIAEITKTSIELEKPWLLMHKQIDRKISFVATNPENLFYAVARVTSLAVKNNNEVYTHFVNMKIREHTESFWVPKVVASMNQHQGLIRAVNTVKISLNQKDLKIVKEHADKIKQICELTVAPTGVFLKGRFKDVMQAQAFIAYRLDPEEQKKGGQVVFSQRSPQQHQQQEQPSRKQEGKLDLAAYLRQKLN